MVKIGGSTSKSTQQETLDPTAKGGLDFLINQAQRLGGAPLTPDLSAGTLGAIETVGTGLGGIDPTALQAILGEIQGDFAPGGRESLERATSFAGERAATEVADVFTSGGRTGSPAEAKAIAEGVAGAVAPFEFQFEQSELRRQDQDRATRIASAFGLANLQSQSDLAEFQGQLAQLEANGLIDANARAKLEEPFRRLGLLAGVITPAAGQAPSSFKGTGSQFGFGLNIAAPTPKPGG